MMREAERTPANLTQHHYNVSEAMMKELAAIDGKLEKAGWGVNTPLRDLVKHLRLPIAAPSVSNQGCESVAPLRRTARGSMMGMAPNPAGGVDGRLGGTAHPSIVGRTGGPEGVMSDSQTLQAVVDRIVRRNEAITSFWSEAFGWAPLEAAQLLSRSRLDWQVSLSRTLTLWIAPRLDQACPDADGCLILAWANLGALVEGTLKWLACVYYDDYCQDQNAIRDKRGATVDPSGVAFDRLRVFFQKSVWAPHDAYDSWILEIQRRRNAIHAFADRAIGTFDEFYEAVRKYAEFLQDMDNRVPYP
ncbi:MAG TPA: hypothetical protein VF121_19405 [Thermoanaerobaculia bacterium]|nr:hypothetical protein [Thermoanaerobaculia bacterium]